MKHKFSGISAIAVAALMLTATGAALPAFADGDHRARMVEMIERLDTNQDGQIDRDEFMAARDEKFVALDGDGDGSVTQAEWEAAVAAFRAEHGMSDSEDSSQHHDGWFAKLDKDSDGSVNRDEFDAAAERMFTRFDRNGDGVLTDADRKEG